MKKKRTISRDFELVDDFPTWAFIGDVIYFPDSRTT